jgi:uncharacterized protein (DUF2236 family)
MHMLAETLDHYDYPPGVTPPEDIPVYEAPPVVYRVWGRLDPILLIFAGSAAEFALNKEVDWLFWTNRLPRNPIGRFFSTVRFAQAIMLGDPPTVAAAIAAVNAAHARVERSRGRAISAWAYRDVLFMLIHYGERAHQIVYGPMTAAEQADHCAALVALGAQMHIPDLPASYADYQRQRQAHLLADLARTPWTDQLYARYRAELGPVRMRLLLDLQASLVPPEVVALLDLRPRASITRLLRVYPHVPGAQLMRLLAPVLLPSRYTAQLAALARPGGLAPRWPARPAQPAAPPGVCPWSG